MKKVYKKLLSITMFLFITVFTLGMFDTNVSADEEVEGKTATIVMASNDWEVGHWGPGDAEGIVSTDAKITGDGKYTVKLDFTGHEKESASNFIFLGLEIVEGEELFSDKHVVIDELKFNDEKYEDLGTTYTNAESNQIGEDEDGNPILGTPHTRVNLFNEWVGVVNEGRTATGSKAGVTATPVKDANELVDIETIEITFTVRSGVSFTDTPTIAYLQFADDGWGEGQYWYDGNEYAGVVSTTDVVTGFDEQYTVSLDFTELDAGHAGKVAFFDVEILNGEFAFPESYMRIDEVKINGTVVELETKTYTTSDNEGETRTNLYNEWVGGPIVQGRSLDGSLEGISAKPVSFEGITEVETIEVKFTLLEGLKLGATPLPEEGTSAYIVVADSTWAVEYWGIDDDANHPNIKMTMPKIQGYGEYTVGIDFSEITDVQGKISGVEFLGFEILGGELYFPSNFTEIIEIKVNGDVFELSGKAYTTSDNGVDTRVNLYNDWVTEIDSGRTAEGVDLSEVSAKPLDLSSITEITSLEIKFVIHERALEVEEEYELPENPEFLAYMMFNDTADYWKIFDPIGTVDEPSAGEAIVTGDGTYTVYVKGSEIDAIEKAEKGRVFLIDIQELGKAMVHLGTLRENASGKLIDTDASVTVKIWIDGEEITVTQNRVIIGDIEDNGRFRIEIYNEYGPTADMPAVDPELLTPESEIKITFTLTGTGIEGEEPVEPEPTDPEPTDPEPTDPEPTDPEPEEESTNLTWLWITLGTLVLAGAGVAVYFFVIKKK